jgi:hypothetical protein
MVLRSAINSSSSATSGQTASNLPAACGSEVITCTRSAPRKEIHLPPNILQLSVSRRRNPPPRKLSGLQTRKGGDAEEEVAGNTEDYNGKRVLFEPLHSRHVLRGGFPRQDRGTATASHTSGGRSRHYGTQGPCGLTPT